MPFPDKDKNVGIGKIQKFGVLNRYVFFLGKRKNIPLLYTYNKKAYKD